METMLEIRRALRLSQAEMASQLGVSQSTISRFETGELIPDRRTLLAAQSLLDGKAAA